MIYDLSNILDRDRFKRRSNQLYEKQRVVELTEKRPIRTLSQNAYLHLIIGWHAIETGNTVEYVKQNYFKRFTNPSIFLRFKDDKHLGRVDVLRSTKDCDTSEITTAIERFRNWSSMECGIYLPSPEEKEFLQSIEIEMKRHEEWI